MVRNKQERLAKLQLLLRTMDTKQYVVIVSRMMNVIAKHDPKHEYQCRHNLCPNCMTEWGKGGLSPAFPFVLYNPKLDLMYNFILCPDCSAISGVNHKNELPPHVMETVERNIVAMWDNGNGQGSVTVSYK